MSIARFNLFMRWAFGIVYSMIVIANLDTTRCRIKFENDGTVCALSNAKRWERHLGILMTISYALESFEEVKLTRLTSEI